MAQKNNRVRNIFERQKKTASKASAQNTTLCELPERLVRLTKAVKTATGRDSNWPVELKVILLLQCAFGLRISEVLSIRPYDLLAGNRIRIISKKKSNPRIIVYADSYGYLQKCKSLSLTPFRSYNRFWIYRQYKQAGIFLEVNSSSKLAVTHSLRHLLIQSLQHEDIDISLSASFLGHKDEKNTKIYQK